MNNETNEPIKFSNPRHYAHFTDWPSGGKRVPCTFAVEDGGKKGFRVTRTTTGKPKKDTYNAKVAIVDGSNGRTYILTTSRFFPSVQVSSSDFMNATVAELGHNNPVYPGNAKYDELSALVNAAHGIGTVAATPAATVMEKTTDDENAAIDERANNAAELADAHLRLNDAAAER